MQSPGRRPTAKDVAAEAGVAVMTVSYTFNRPGRVAEATRRRVLETADRLGYRRPDSTARALRSGRTGQVGVVVGEHLSYAFDDPQAAQFLAGVADVCVQDGRGMVLIPTHGDVRDDDAPAGGPTGTAPGTTDDVDRVLAAAVDAYVLWTTTSDDPVLPAIASSGRPAAIQGGPAHPGIVRIGPDDRTAAAAVATAALTATAPTAVAPTAAPATAGTPVPAAGAPAPVPVVLSFPLDRRREPRLLRGGDLPDDLDDVAFPVTGARLAGYREALIAHGHPWESTAVAVVGRNGRDEGATAARSLLEATEDDVPLVVLAMSDELALGAREVLVAAGRPARVTGWDASPAARAAGITSVTNPLREQGRACARAALDPDYRPGGVGWEVVGADPAWVPT